MNKIRPFFKIVLSFILFRFLYQIYILLRKFNNFYFHFYFNFLVLNKMSKKYFFISINRFLLNSYESFFINTELSPSQELINFNFYKIFNYNYNVYIFFLKNLNGFNITTYKNNNYINVLFFNIVNSDYFYFSKYFKLDIFTFFKRKLFRIHYLTRRVKKKIYKVKSKFKKINFFTLNKSEYNEFYYKDCKDLLEMNLFFIFFNNKKFFYKSNNFNQKPRLLVADKAFNFYIKKFYKNLIFIKYVIKINLVLVFKKINKLLLVFLKISLYKYILLNKKMLVSKTRLYIGINSNTNSYNYFLQKSYHSSKNNLFFSNFILLLLNPLHFHLTKNTVTKNNNLFFNNVYPIFFNKKILNTFLLKFKSKSVSNFVKYFHIYVINYFELFFKKRFFVVISSSFNKFYPGYNYLLSIYNNYKKVHYKFNKHFHINDMLEIIWLSFYYKDLSLLTNWLNYMLDIIFFKDHRKFLNTLFTILVKHSGIFLNTLKINGFFISVKGKISVAGNGKKKKSFLKIGRLYKSTKAMRIDHKQSCIKTNYGSLGINMMLSY